MQKIFPLIALALIVALVFMGLKVQTKDRQIEELQRWLELAEM